MEAPIDIFIVYSSKDAALRQQFETHLSPLRQDGAIRTLSDHSIVPGEEYHGTINNLIDSAAVIVLLVSADFIASDYCYGMQMERALSRRSAGKAEVIPVVLRACDWSETPFSRLQALPTDAKPVTSWPNRDEAWADVARGIREVVETLLRREVSIPVAGARRTGGIKPGLLPSPTVPVYPDAETRILSERLELARERRLRLQAEGFETEVADVNREILSLRRQIREGGSLRAGDSLGDSRYLLVRHLGRGGFAIVWDARDRESGEHVAIKVLHSQFSGEETRRERFFRGAKRMAELKHEAVVRVLDPHGEDGGYHYFVMELVRGGDLRDAVLDGQIAPEAIIPVILTVGGALAAAHAQGLVHRDVKPANILLDESGAPKLTDFDLVGAKDTTGGTRTGALGSLLYAAPELLDRPQDADARADVYGLGMTAIFGLHGAELSIEHFRDLDTILRNLPCTELVRAALKRAVELERDERYADAGAFCIALRTALKEMSSGDATFTSDIGTEALMHSAEAANTLGLKEFPAVAPPPTVLLDETPDASIVANSRARRLQPPKLQPHAPTAVSNEAAPLTKPEAIPLPSPDALSRAIDLDLDALERAAAEAQAPFFQPLHDRPPPPAAVLGKRPAASGYSVRPAYESSLNSSPPASSSQVGHLAPPAPGRVPPPPVPTQPLTIDPASSGRYAPSRPAAIFATERPPEGASIFGEDLISEKALDEVILSYLAEDLEGPAEKK